MFFWLSKTLDLLAEPLWWALGGVLAGLVVLARGRRRGLGLGLGLGGLAVLVVASLPAVANRLEAALESTAQQTMRPGVTYDAVVLLGGVSSSRGALPTEPAWNDSIERLTVTRTLLATGRARKVIVSGGSLGVPGLPTEAEFLASQLVEWGVPREQIILEDQALNTRQNALFTQAIVEQQGLSSLLVVTSAFHLPRAMGCFRAVGLKVDGLPVDYRVRNPGRDPNVLPRAEYLWNTSRVVREWVGARVYWLLGYAR